MRRISSGATSFYKTGFPVLWFGFLATFLAVVIVASISRGEFHPMFVAAPLFMAVFGYVIMRVLLFDLVDEVWDDGDALVVRSRGEEVRVPIANIVNVADTRFVNPPRIRLTLLDPCPLGKEIVFSPPRPGIPGVLFGTLRRNPVAEDLIRRLEAVRRGAG